MENNVASDLFFYHLVFFNVNFIASSFLISCPVWMFQQCSFILWLLAELPSPTTITATICVRSVVHGAMAVTNNWTCQWKK